MTTINTSSPLASYLASAGKAPLQPLPAARRNRPRAARTRLPSCAAWPGRWWRAAGGLLRALNGGGSLQPRSSPEPPGSKAGESGAKIELPTYPPWTATTRPSCWCRSTS